MSDLAPAQPAYRDFVLRVSRENEDTYLVEAQGPAGGEARSRFRLPFDGKDLQIFLLQVGHPRRVVVRGHVPTPLQPTVDFGRQLYDAVVAGEVRDLWIRARADGDREGYGLRLKLRLADAPQLSDLPWEFLYDGRDFCALSSSTPLVRSLDLAAPARPMKVSLPLRLLVTISAPQDLPLLDVDAEQAYIQEALSEVEDRVQVDFTDGMLRTLQRTLRQARQSGQPYHAWHYIGHGGFDPQTKASVLMFCDRSGMSSPVGGFQLGTLFASYPEVRLALLNACEGARPDIQDPFAGVAAALVERGISAVIGMQFEISDEAATTFASEFYRALADGLPVDAALTEARRAVFFLPNWVEWATPVLHMRAPDGILFHVDDKGLDKKALKAQEQAIKDRLEQEEDERKAWEKAAREARKAAEQREKKEEKRREEAKVGLPAILSPRQDFEPEMVLIPAGSFLMGSDAKKDPDAREDEQPQHELYLPDYHIARTPVTNTQYQAFVQAVDHDPPEYWDGQIPPVGLEDHPVVKVSWYDAMDYCRWLAEITGRPYRLPSEAEWEKAARGTEGWIYPWGDEDPREDLCNSGSVLVTTTPVTRYSPQGDSLYGCADMAGNVWEWTHSLWGEDLFVPTFRYPYVPGDEREDEHAETQVRRVLRGGAFNNGAWYLRCAVRLRTPPDIKLRSYGFRAAMAPKSPSLR